MLEELISVFDGGVGGNAEIDDTPQTGASRASLAQQGIVLTCSSPWLSKAIGTTDARLDGETC